MSSDSPSHSSDQIEEVWSWIHDEHRCVTTQTIAMTLGVSRQLASDLLRAIPSFRKPSSRTYELVECRWVQEEGGSTSVVKLVKSTLSDNDEFMMSGDGSSMLYSLALKDTETLSTAHEKDRALFRDQLKEEDTTMIPSHALDATLHTDAIGPSVVEQMERVSLQSSRNERVANIGEPAAASSSFASMSTKPKSRKTHTTAADFFSQLSKSHGDGGDGGGGTKKQKKEASESKPSQKRPPATTIKTRKKSIFGTTTTTTSSTTITATKSRVSSLKPSKTAVVTTLARDAKESAKDDRNDTVGIQEKENTPNESRKVGNADDFVGDEDEDEEFLKEEEDRRRRNRQRERKEEEDAERRRERQQQRQQTRQPTPDTPKGRKRRKRLVEKTSMDSNGYLHTETHAVWEEVPSDEETEQTTRTTVVKPKIMPKKKKVDTKHLKQGNLMGFFSKKK